MTSLAVIIGTLTLLRLILAAIVPVAPDEAYYWVWSHALAPGYVDHPPMVALWIRAGTALAGQTALGVRLLGPLAAALASWMLFDAGRRLFDDARAGLIATLLLNATLLVGAGSVIMTPDSPLLFFWTACLWATCRLSTDGRAAWWLIAGLFGGLALDSKYTAMFLWIGIGLWALWVPHVRAWLRRWQPWAACGIGLLLFAPVLIWNAQHRWIGLVRQGGRVGDWRPARALGFLAELLGSQVGLATPLIFLLCMIGLLAACRRAWRGRAPGWSLLALLSLPSILMFLQHAIGDRVQGNWPAVVYPALTLAAAGVVTGVPRPAGGVLGRWRTAVVLGFAMTGVAYLQAAAGLFPLPPRLDPVALRLSGWDTLAGQVQRLALRTDAVYVAAEGYALGGELAWALPATIPVLGLDVHWASTTLPRAITAGRPGLLLRDVRNDAAPASPPWSDAERVGTVERPGVPAGAYAVYRVSGQDLPAVTLPER